MSIRVYIAASSDEWAKAKCWADKLRAAGVTVVSTWTESLPASGGVANPDDALHDERYAWASQCLREVDSCNVLWLILPSKGHGRGAYFEAGAAHVRGLHVVTSGDKYQSIFTARASCFTSEQVVFDWLVSEPEIIEAPVFSKRWGNWGEA